MAEAQPRRNEVEDAPALALFLDFRDCPDLGKPALLRACPDLPLGNELITLAHRAHTKVVDLRPVADRRRVDARAAARTERLLSLRAAFPGLDVDGGFAGQDAEGVIRRRDRDSKRGA